MKTESANRIKAAADFYNYSGPLEPGMLHLIEEEGFVAGEYKDDVGISTEGVGATGENKGKNFFTEVYPKYMARAAKKVKGFTEMPEDLQNAVLSAVYRGDLGPKTAKLLSEGDYAAAADEYLDHAEYKKRKKKDPDDGVVKRMERNAEAMRRHGESEPKPDPMAARGL